MLECRADCHLKFVAAGIQEHFDCLRLPFLCGPDEGCVAHAVNGVMQVGARGQGNALPFAAA